MRPAAYLIFLVLNNKRPYIGDAAGKGLKREIFNVLLVIALLSVKNLTLSYMPHGTVLPLLNDDQRNHDRNPL